ALVRVDEAVRQPPRHAVEAQRQRQPEDGEEKGAGEVETEPAPGDGPAHSPPAGTVAAPPLASSRKQLTAPVWHAGPAHSTVISTVSWSQSSRRDSTRCTLPLVPPLCQSSRRLRLQKCVSPLESVVRNASLLA